MLHYLNALSGMKFSVFRSYIIAYFIFNLRAQIKERNADYNRIVSTITSKAQPRWLNKLAVEKNSMMKSSDKQDRSKSSSAANRAAQLSYTLKKRYQPWIDQVPATVFY